MQKSCKLITFYFYKSPLYNSCDFRESFNYVYSKCLQDSCLASKLVTMVSSYSFITTEIHEQKIRNLFITHIQNDFEGKLYFSFFQLIILKIEAVCLGCKQLQRMSPVAFRNSIRMLGEFYHKARLADGRVIKFLAGPVMQYFEMLLDSSQPPDLELFTSQVNLYQEKIFLNLRLII